MTEGEVTVDGRTVAYADHGPADGTPVLWCHGGPGSRLEPLSEVAKATAAGYRLVGIDRPGYGRSTVQPGRTIAGWVPDGLAVADALGIDRFIAVGVSTGGAYALVLAALAPERVTGVVACCALTDMQWAEGKGSMGSTQEIWSAPDRDAALQVAVAQFGEDGSTMLAGGDDAAASPLTAPDLALLADAEYLTATMRAVPAMFAQGVAGYADDRIADGPGWHTFDVGAVRCPVIVLHGEQDGICPVAHAHHTAAIVPDARLELRAEHGHLSVVGEVVGVLDSLGART